MLKQAGAVFAERGYHAASMDEIADRVGLSKPMIYSHFGSKEALYFAYIEAAGAELLRAIAEAYAGAEHDVESRMWAGTHAFFAFVDEHRDGYAVLFGELASNGAPFRREVSTVRRQIIDLVMVVCRQAVREAGVDSGAIGDPEPLAHAYVGAGESLANWWLEHPDVSVGDVTTQLYDIAWQSMQRMLGGAGATAPTVQ